MVIHRWLRAHRPGLDPVTVTDLTPVEIRDRLDELDGILATAPPDQTRILDALRSGELTAVDLDDAIAAAVATHDSRRDWILEHWPHLMEHVELTRLAAQHGPLDHWPIPLPAAAQRLYDQLAALTADAAEPRPLTQLDRELADAHPYTHLDRLQRQLDTLDEHLADLDAERSQLTERPERVVDIDHHIAELHRRRRDLTRELAGYNAKSALWKTGHRPQPVIDAIGRRSRHLAHTAITGGEPWVTEAVRTWHGTHTDDIDTHHLYRIIVAVAAHRERSGHNGPDPIGPSPDPEHALYDSWQRLNRDLTDAATPTPTVAPLGR